MTPEYLGPSTAERIARSMGRDGSTWTMPDGTDLTGLIGREPGVTHRDLLAGGSVAIFADGSAIFTGCYGWDVVAPDGDGWRSVDRHGLPTRGVRYEP